MKEQIIDGAADGTAYIGKYLTPINASTTSSYVDDAVTTVFENSTTYPWYDAYGDHYIRIITGQEPAGNPRIVNLIVAQPSTPDNQLPYLTLLGYAPVYMEDVRLITTETGRALTLRVRFSPPAN